MTQELHDRWQRDRLLEALDAYRRGISDAPRLRKWSGSTGEAQGQAQGQPMAFVISTDEVDRHGDVIAADGWNLDSYRKNPVFLWAHDYARPVIGKAEDVWKEPHRLMAKIRFAPTDFAQEVAALYETGYQSGVSVGFKPLRYEERRGEKTGVFLGIRFLEQELLEASAVPVPANRNALRRALDQAPRLKQYLSGFDYEEANSARNPTGQKPWESHSLNMTKNNSGRTASEAVWPLVSAQVDELEKMVGELAEMVEKAAHAADRGQGPCGVDQEDVDQVLSALRSPTTRRRSPAADPPR